MLWIPSNAYKVTHLELIAFVDQEIKSPVEMNILKAQFLE